jgi:hypothetical protein
MPHPSPAARAALRNLAKRERDGSFVILPSPPRNLDSIQVISWWEDQARTADQDWAKTHEYFHDLKEGVLPDAAGKAAVRKAEQLAESLRRRKDATEAMAARLRAQHDAMANSISIDGYETRQASLLARAACEGRLA